MFKTSFEDYKELHNFMHPEEPLKAWINETNFVDPYREWESLMEVVEKAESLKVVMEEYLNEEVVEEGLEGCISVYMEGNSCTVFHSGLYVNEVCGNALGSKKESVYVSMLDFVKWLKDKSYATI